MIRKCCLFINADPQQQALFTEALLDVSPETLCITAHDGIDALYMMLNDKLVPDYIFVDLTMPHMDGISFLKEIKKIIELKDIPVVVNGGSCQEELLDELKHAGAKAIMTKGYTYQTICNMISLYFNDSVIWVHPN